MNRFVVSRFFVCLICGFLVPTVAFGADSPQFRGPGGQGHYDVQRLPLTWKVGAPNLGWSTPIDGLGWSSPVLKDGQIWLTTATDEGKSLRLLAIDVESGKIARDVEVFKLDEPGPIHAKNSHASPTPILDGDRIYVHFGAHGTACVSTKGEILWQVKLPYNHIHGPGNSPALVGDALIINCDGGDVQYVTALDRRTGEALWKVDRPENPFEKKFSFCTPLPIEVNGHTQVVSAGAGGVTSFDPRGGREIWRVDYPKGYSVVPRPVYGHGMIFLSSGFDTPKFYAIRVGGEGNVTETHVAWTLDRGAPRNASPLLIGDELYLVSDNGVATCVDAKTGEELWQERLGGDYTASPFYAAGRIYFLSEDAKMTVLAPGREYQVLAVNELLGRTLATPLPIDGALLVRTSDRLLRINAEE